ncbi:MAG TPA: VOC family protein [Candidatus Acidoferrales bacterium]|nr:VOC family protein [Candidatus Acidoferrales bacterium]
MEAEVLGIDHIYISVRSLIDSQRFYDRVLVDVLGFRKNQFELNGVPHVQYYNRQFGFVIRAARPGSAPHDCSAPGLHHFCLRVESEAEIDRVARALTGAGIDVEAPRYYPHYAADYYAIFFTDPDGIRLEVTNFRAERKARLHSWDESAGGSSTLA